MEHFCGSISIEILGYFTKAQKCIFCVLLCQILLLLWTIFYPMTNFPAVPASIFISIFGLRILSGNSFSGTFVKFSSSGFSSKTSSTSSSVLCVEGLITSLKSPSLESSSSTSTSSSSSRVDGRFVGFLGEIHFIQTFCQLD